VASRSAAAGGARQPALSAPHHAAASVRARFTAALAAALLDRLRRDPRFAALLRRLDLPAD